MEFDHPANPADITASNGLTSPISKNKKGVMVSSPDATDKGSGSRLRSESDLNSFQSPQKKRNKVEPTLKSPGSLKSPGGDVSEVTSEEEASIREWIYNEYQSNSKRVFKFSDAKDKFPTIHLKWIEQAFNKFEKEGLFVVPAVRSRIKLFEINSQFLGLPQSKKTNDDSTNGTSATTHARPSKPSTKDEETAMLSPSRPTRAKSSSVPQSPSPAKAAAASSTRSPSKASPSKGVCLLSMFYLKFLLL